MIIFSTFFLKPVSCKNCLQMKYQENTNQVRSEISLQKSTYILKTFHRDDTSLEVSHPRSFPGLAEKWHKRQEKRKQADSHSPGALNYTRISEGKSYAASLLHSFPVPAGSTHDLTFVMKERQRHTIKHLWIGSMKVQPKKYTSQFSYRHLISSRARSRWIPTASKDHSARTVSPHKKVTMICPVGKWWAMSALRGTE